MKICLKDLRLCSEAIREKLVTNLRAHLELKNHLSSVHNDQHRDLNVGSEADHSQNIDKTFFRFLFLRPECATRKTSIAQFLGRKK